MGSKPEYFLDCWLEEEERRHREYQRKQTKRRRVEKEVIVPQVRRQRLNKFGEVVDMVFGERVVVDRERLRSSVELLRPEPSSTTPSLEEFSTNEDLCVAFADAPLPSHPCPPKPTTSTTLSSSPNPALVPPPFVAPTTFPSQNSATPEPLQRSSLLEQITSGPGIAGLKPPESPKVSTENTSAKESVTVPPSRPPLSFHSQITSGLGISGLKPTKVEPRSPRDYRPAFVKDIENRPTLRPVRSLQEKQEEVSPLLAKLKAMRILMAQDDELDELAPPPNRKRASTDWSVSTLDSL